MSRQRKDPISRRATPWLLTYSDIVTLLMIFFVLLMATGDVKIIKTRIILSAFEGKLGVLRGGQSLSPGAFENMGQRIESLPSTERSRFLSKSYKKAINLFQPEIKSRKLRVLETERGLVISLMSDVLFEGGSADVHFEDIKSTLENLRLLIETLDDDQKILIEGHTDSIDYEGHAYKDNWDLSTARAWSILNALRLIPSLTAFDESKVSIHGYGRTRPVENNDTPEGRAYNRRVDIIFSHKGL